MRRRPDRFVGSLAPPPTPEAGATLVLALVLALVLVLALLRGHRPSSRHFQPQLNPHSHPLR
jgi:hypothetical protein